MISSKGVLRLLGVFFVADGVSLLTFGRAYLRLWQVGPTTSPYGRAMAWLVGRPGWLLRLAGAVETGLGLVVLGRVPMSVQEIYRTFAGPYDAVSFVWRRWLYRDIHLAFDRVLSAYLPPGGQVLDLGCGTAANLERLLALRLPFGSYTGVDLSEAMLTQARAKFSHIANASFQELNLLTGPLPAGPFDVVISTWVFSHLSDPERVVVKALERLRPGGHVVLLFQVESGTWLDHLRRPILGWFSSRPVPEDVYRRFPGLIAVDRFAGGTATLAVLRKPVETG